MVTAEKYLLHLQQKLDFLLSEIAVIKNGKAYKTTQEQTDLCSYFENLKKDIETETVMLKTKLAEYEQ